MKCRFLLFTALFPAIVASAQDATDSLENFGLHLRAGLMISSEPQPQIDFLDLGGADVRRMTSVYAGLLLDRELFGPVDLQLSGSYARRGTHYDGFNATLVNHYLDGHLALMGGNDNGRIGPVLTYTHLLASRLDYRSETGQSVSQDLTPDDSPLAFGVRGEARMQEGLYLTAGAHWRPAGVSFDHFSVGMRIDLNRKRVNTRKALKQFEKDEAARHIQQLRDGVLLVRLNTLYTSIDALREKGYNETADEMEDAIRVQNLAVMNAFRNEFDFCPVYFYYSHDARDVIAGAYTGRLFTAQGDSTISHDLASLQCYIAEFGNLEDDTSSYLVGYQLVRTGDFSVEREARYARGSTFNFAALKIKGPDYFQLRRPFPFYVKTNSFMFTRSPFGIISQLNNNFHTFYQQQAAWRKPETPPLE